MPFDLTPENAARFSREASALVRGYIAAQNDVFKFSFMRALGLKKPDAANAASDASPLLDKTRAMLEEVRELKLDANEPLGAFFMTMRPYLRALEEAMTFFINFCGKIDTAQKDQHSRYWKETYKADLLELQHKEQEYLKIGLELNEKWKALKGAQ